MPNHVYIINGHAQSRISDLVSLIILYTCDYILFFQGEEYTSMKFVYNASCMYPLVRTVNEDSYYEDIDGCGIQCMNPLFTDAEHRSLHIFIGIVASLCLISTLITVVSFS